MNSKLKFDMYILSLSLFFLRAIILEFKIPECENGTVFDLLLANASCFVFAILIIYCVFAYYKFRFLLDGSGELPIRLAKVTGANSDPLDFLSTFIMPLITLNLGKLSSYIVIAILLIAIGIIYIKTEKYCQNPILALLGFNLYKVEFSNCGRDVSVIALSLSSLTVSTSVRWIKLSENVIFVR